MAFSEEWAAAVRSAIGSRSQRQIAARTGVSQTYIGNMLLGQVPSRDVAIRFAEATGAEPNALLRAAGLEPLFRADEAFNEGLREIRAAYPRAAGLLTMTLREVPAAQATEQDVKEMLADLRERAREIEEGSGDDATGAAGKDVGAKARSKRDLETGGGGKVTRFAPRLCPA